MTSKQTSISSARIDVAGTLDDAIEECFRRGWTDGLPVVPPTEAKVLAFLAASGRDPSDIIGIEPIRSRVVTAEKIAINAVMAGCRPAYMPVVLAAVEAMVDPAYSLHGSSASTGGSAPMVIVNGPVRNKLGFQSGYNLFAGGPDFRPNATVGRALRLILINVVGNIPGVLDLSTMGFGGKFSFCFAEDEETSPWAPLHVDKGFASDASTVTVSASQSPLQVRHTRSGTPEAILDAAADGMLTLGPSNGEVYLVLPYEHLKVFDAAGWSKDQLRDYLHAKARRPAQEWADANLAELPSQDAEQEMVPVLKEPGSLILVAGGGPGGSTCAIIPRWSGGNTAFSVTREIDATRI